MPPIDPCGLAFDLAKGQGSVEMAFWRDDPRRTRVAVYQIPRSRAWVPGVKTFLLASVNRRPIRFPIPDGGVGDDAYSFVGAFGWVPPFDKQGDHYCGTADQWRYGAAPTDPPLDWTTLLFSTCCEGVLPVGTANRIAKFGPGGLSVGDSRMLDTGADCILAEACMRVDEALFVRAAFDLTSMSFRHITSALVGSAQWLAPSPPASAYVSAKVTLSSHPAEVIFDLDTIPVAAPASFSVNGVKGGTFAANGWDVRGGLVIDLPGAGDWTTFLGLGTAAFTDAADYLLVANDLSDLADAPTARTNLGLGTMAVEDAADFLAVANDLSDLADAPTARTNLGLGTMAVEDAADFLAVANDLSDLADAPTARDNLGIGSDILTTTGPSVLGGTFSVSADSTWQTVANGGNNVELSLAAGTWRITYCASSFAAVTIANGWMAMRLYNATAGAAVANSEVRLGRAIIGTNFGSGGSNSITVTLAGTSTIRMEAWRDTGPTWSFSNILSDAVGRTSMSAVLLFD